MTHLPSFIRSLLSTQIALLTFCYKIKVTKLFLAIKKCFFGLGYFVHMCSLLMFVVKVSGIFSGLPSPRKNHVFFISLFIMLMSLHVSTN